MCHFIDGPNYYRTDDVCLVLAVSWLYNFRDHLHPPEFMTSPRDEEELYRGLILSFQQQCDRRWTVYFMAAWVVVVVWHMACINCIL